MTNERKNPDIEGAVTDDDASGHHTDDTGRPETQFEDVAGIGDEPEDAVPVAAPPTPPD